MASPSPPSLPSSPASISADALAEAAERRTREATPQLTAARLAIEHERRQKFRRMIDPGITRPNAKEQAMSSLKTLLTISENLIREPDNEKYQQFKPTNSTIKRELVDRKGALEFAIELGFRPEVKNFQPYYTFHRRHFEDLKIGAAILKEYITLETRKEERTSIARKSEKAAHDAAAEKVKLAFMDDRKSKLLRDEMEREQRAARAEAAAKQAALEAAKTPRHERTTSPEVRMPGTGHDLSNDQIVEDAMVEDQDKLPEHRNR